MRPNNNSSSALLLTRRNSSRHPLTSFPILPILFGFSFLTAVPVTYYLFCTQKSLTDHRSNCTEAVKDHLPRPILSLFLFPLSGDERPNTLLVKPPKSPQTSFEPSKLAYHKIASSENKADACETLSAPKTKVNNAPHTRHSSSSAKNSQQAQKQDP